MEKKITKRENFVEIVNLLTDMGRTDLADVVAHEIELLDGKAAKAKARAAKKKEEFDELSSVVEQVLTDEFQTIAQITAQIAGEDVSTQKVTSRLTKLFDAGRVVKEQISVPTADGKSRKCMAYKLAPIED